MRGNASGLTPAMRRVVAAVVALVAVLAVAALALWFLSTAGGPDTRAAGPGHESSAAAATASAAPTSPGASESTTPSGATSSDASESSPGTLPRTGHGPAATAAVDPMASSSTIAAPTGSAGPVVDAKPSAGSEAQPYAPTPQPQPRPKQAKPLLTSAPKSSSKVGALVSGYPRQVMGPSTGSAVSSSSVASQGHRVQVSLVAHTGQSAKSVKAHYQKVWSALGLSPSATTDGTLVYSGTYDSLTLSFPESATDTRYAVYGTFRTT